MSDKKAGILAKLKKKAVSFLISFGLVGTCLGMLWHHYRTNGNNGDDLITQMENTLLDLRFRFRGPIKPSGKMGILAIDEKSLQKFGRWPIARKDYEKVFANLKTL